MTWGPTTASALFAVRDILKTNINAQLAAKQVDITAAGRAYTIPTEMVTDNIRIRQTVYRQLPQYLPTIHIVYIDRTVTEFVNFASNADISLWVHVWFNQRIPSGDDDLDPEEVLILTCFDIQDAIIRSLRRRDLPSAGIYGKSGGTLQNIEATSEIFRSAHVTQDAEVQTIESRTRFRLLQRVEY